MTFSDFVLGKDTQTGQAVTIALPDRLRGEYIIGTAGSGKSHLMKSGILQDIEQGHGVCIIDPHEDMITDTLKSIPSHRLSDVILLDPLDREYSFGINMLEADTTNSEAMQLAVDYQGQIFGKLFTPSGELIMDAPNLARTLRNAAYVLIDNADRYQPTLAEIPLLIDNPSARKKLLENVKPKNSLAKRFWEEYAAMDKPADKLQLTGSTISRLEPFLENEFIKHVVGQGKSTINFRRFMDTGKIVLVPLPRQHEQLSILIGSLIISKIIQAAFSRVDIPETQRKPFFLYIDELGLFSSPALAKMIGTLAAESRKFGLGFIGSHQFRQQLDQDTRAATLNMHIKVVFAVQGVDSEELAKEYSINNASPPNEQRILSASIVPTLLKDGHPDRHIVEFIQKYLRQLAEARADEVDEVSMGRYSPRASIRPVMRVTTPKLPRPFRYTYDPDDVKRGLIRLNDWLYNGLRNGDVFPPVDPGMLSLLAPALCFPNFFKIKYEEPTEQIRKTSQRMKDIYNERKQVIWEPLRQSKGDETKRLLDKEEEYNKRYWEESILFKVDGISYLEDMLLQQKKRYPLGGDVQTLGSLYDGAMSPAEVPREQNINFIALEMYALEELNHDHFIGSLRLAFYALEKQPLLANGKIYGVETASQRTIADLEKELAKELANPKQPYTARVKLGTQEHTIQALPLPPVPTSGDYLQEKIRRSNQMDGYLRKREDIDRELESRHERLTALSSGSDVLPVTDTQMALIPSPSSLPVPSSLPERTPAPSPPPQPRQKVFRRFEGNVEREANLNGSGGYHAVGEVEMVRVPNLNGGGGFTWQPLPKIAQRTFHQTHRHAEDAAMQDTTPNSLKKRSKQDEDEE